LPHNHRYHEWKTQFDCTIDNEEAPKHQDGKFMLEMIKNINVIFWKPVTWKKEEEKQKGSKGLSI
jgi:hypothetical protein